MHEIPIPPRWFLMRPPSHEPEGPFDLEELAALLRTGDITGETLTKREGADERDWVAFKQRPEFATAANEPAEVIEQHLEDEAAQEVPPWWTLQRLYYLGAVAGPPFIVLGYYLYTHPGVAQYLQGLFLTELGKFLNRY
jgi:hypothetical protein